MATRTRNISLPPEADAYLERSIRRYGNASAVVQAGLRALAKAELSDVWREWKSDKQSLPAGPPITTEIEQSIEASIKTMRRAEKRKHKK